MIYEEIEGYLIETDEDGNILNVFEGSMGDVGVDGDQHQGTARESDCKRGAETSRQIMGYEVPW